MGEFFTDGEGKSALREKCRIAKSLDLVQTPAQHNNVVLRFGFPLAERKGYFEEALDFKLSR